MLNLLSGAFCDQCVFGYLQRSPLGLSEVLLPIKKHTFLFNQSGRDHLPFNVALTALNH